MTCAADAGAAPGTAEVADAETTDARIIDAGIIDAALAELAAACLGLLRGAGSTLATAESLTAGLVCATLAAVPGASDVLRGGVAAYASDVKVAVLRVDSTIVAGHGVISAACAAAMAAGARDLLGAGWAVATTGVAGPAQQEGKPVGTVFIAVAGPGVARVRELALTGCRDDVRRGSVRAALELLRCELSEQAGSLVGDG